jgi:biotin transporter BioY
MGLLRLGFLVEFIPAPAIAGFRLDVRDDLTDLERHDRNWTDSDILGSRPQRLALALICGCAVLGMGLLRLGFLVEFIPAPAIAGFMTDVTRVLVATGFRLDVRDDLTDLERHDRNWTDSDSTRRSSACSSM